MEVGFISSALWPEAQRQTRGRPQRKSGGQSRAPDARSTLRPVSAARSYQTATSPAFPDFKDLQDRKSTHIALLGTIAGIDYGRAFTSERRRRFEDLVALLERQNPTEFSFPQNLNILDGRWRLVYTSNPVPPSVTPLGRLCGIFQEVDTASRRLVNMLEFSAVPQLFSTPVPPATTRVAIGAKFETLDYSRLLITLTDISLSLGNLKANQSVSTPLLPILETFGSDAQDVESTYFAEGVRMLRSKRGELRVFVREHAR